MNTNILDFLRKGIHLLKKSDSMKDSVIVGLMSGLAGSIAIEAVNVVTGKKLLFGKLASSMIVNPFRSYQRKNILLGEAMHLITGSGIGTIIVQVLKRTGKEYMMVKGIFVSLMAWVGLHNFGRRYDMYSNKARSTKSQYASLLQHIFYGITTSAAINYLANPVIFQQASNTQDVNLSLDNGPQYMPSEIDYESEETNTPVVH